MWVSHKYELTFFHVYRENFDSEYAKNMNNKQA